MTNLTFTIIELLCVAIVWFGGIWLFFKVVEWRHTRRIIRNYTRIVSEIKRGEHKDTKFTPEMFSR